MPEEPMDNEQQTEPMPQPVTESGFGETPATDNPEMESFGAKPELEPATPPAPVPPLMTGINIDGIQGTPEPAVPTMAPESLPVQSAPMSEPMAPPVVVTSKKSKMTLYLIIAIVVVVLVTAGYFVYKNSI